MLNTIDPGRSVGQVSTRFHTLSGPFTTQGGATLESVTLAYELYGEISEARDNVIVVFHAITGSQHAAGFNPEVEGVDGRWTADVHRGWWDGFIGPGRAMDTDRYAVLCVNYLGGCYGSTGPASIDPATGKRYGSTFPAVTLTDIVDSQVRLLDELGIDKVHAVIGGSVGGMMSAVFATRYPDRVEVVIPIAAGLRTTTLQALLNFEQIMAIARDPNFQRGDYYDGEHPNVGLAVARTIGHKMFVSLLTLTERARAQVVQNVDLGGYAISSPLESYMLHHSEKFVERFDANTYLIVMRIWQQFDLVQEVGGESMVEVLSRCGHQRWQVFTVDSDVCFYPEEQTEMYTTLLAAGVPARRFTLHSEKGHDSFLTEPHLYAALINDVLAGWHDLTVTDIGTL
ncbi:MAG TPA: homoserine O-acetyltransferase [Acidimicrobiia bacterium]|nr:homoserine O-acetyltransferase [Acidimicrobiia bacterium]